MLICNWQGFSSKQTYVFSNDMSLIYSDIIGRLEPKIAKAAMVLAQNSVQEIFSYYQFVVKSRFLGDSSSVVKQELGFTMDEPMMVKQEVSSADSESEEGEIISD